VLATVLAPWLALAAPARAAGPWLSIGLTSGIERPDPRLADDQWTTTPHAGFGGTALAGFGPFAAGVRGWTTRATQRLGATTSSAVRSTRVELVGEARVATVLGAELMLDAGAGRLHLGYDPDRVSVDTGSGPVTVDLAPIGTWVVEGGFALRRALPAGWSAGLGADYSRWSIDTAHREGATVVEQRQTFGNWSARFELARRFTLP
jgi:hypothetical protein